MTKPPLQLETYYFTKVAVAADPCYQPDDGVVRGMAIDTELGMGQHSDDPSRWMVTLTLRAKSRDDKPIPYIVDLEAVGFFRVEPAASKEKAPFLVQANGGAILYSAAREYLLVVTSRGPWPPITLPTTNFLSAAKFSRGAVTPPRGTEKVVGGKGRRVAAKQ